MLKKGYFLLGKTSEGLLYASLSDLSTHMHVLGATGSGKTLFLTLLDFQTLWQGLPLIKADMKFDLQNFSLVYSVSHFLKQDFYFFNPYQGGLGFLSSLGSHSYNPLLLGNTETITSKIMKSAERQGSVVSFYEEVKENIVLSLVGAMLSTGQRISFKDLWVSLLRGKRGDYPALSRLISLCRNEEYGLSLKELHSRLTHENNMIRSQAEKEITGTRLFFQRFSTGAVGELVNSYESDIELDRVLEKGGVVYFVLPVLLYEVVAKATAKMLLADLRFLTGLMAGLGVKKDFVISIDEFENFVFAGIEDLFNKGRSAGAKLIIAHQSIKDIDFAYNPELRSIIQSNTRIKVFLSQADYESAKWFSELVGTKDVSISMPLEIGNVGEVDQYKIPPKMLTSLKNFQAYFFMKGEAYRGHIFAVPSDFELGVDCPIPSFKPKINREKGIRLFEFYTESNPLPEEVNVNV
ncbi:MAG: TraM recognition domain-containing protein [Ignisphaera sp.]